MPYSLGEIEWGLGMALLSRRPALGNVPGAYAIYVGFASLYLGSWWLFASAMVVVLAALGAHFLKLPSTAAAVTMGVTLHTLEWSLEQLLGPVLTMPENLMVTVMSDPVMAFVAFLSALALISATWGWIKSLVGLAV